MWIAYAMTRTGEDGELAISNQIDQCKVTTGKKQSAMTPFIDRDAPGEFLDGGRGALCDAIAFAQNHPGANFVAAATHRLSADPTNQVMIVAQLTAAGIARIHTGDL